MKVSAHKVGAVIVTYYPDLDRVIGLVEVLGEQVDVIVVVDNTLGLSELAAVLPPTINVVLNGRNAGIAEALNVGVKVLRDMDCDYYFLSDQDSMPAPDIVVRLLAAADTLAACGKTVATVGALFVDPRDGQTHGFPVINGNGLSLRYEPDETGCVPASFVITSGSIISREAMNEVGPMEGGLFIDVVDMEWCYRAASKGYLVYGAPEAMMQHTIGDDFVAYWFFRWKKRPVHSPFRVYFQLRNSIILLGRSYVPLSCKWWMVKSKIAQVFIYIFLVDKKNGSYLVPILKGILHGFIGKRGAIQ